MVKRSVCFILTFVMIVCSLLTDNSVYAASKLTTLKVEKQAVDKNEPSIISRYLIDVAKLYSSFYNDNKIIVEDEKIKNTRLCLTYMVGNVLKIGTGLLGMEMPDRM